MAISFVAAGTGVFGGSNSVTLTWPTGYAVGDLLVAAYTWDGTNSPITSGTPSGWTQLILQSNALSGVYILYKIATSTSEATFAVTSSGFELVGQSFAYRGMDAVTPIDGTAVTSTVGSGASLATNTLTTTVANDWVVSVWGDGSVSGTSVLAMAAPGTTLRGSANMVLGTNAGFYVGDEVQATAGTSTARTLTETGATTNSITSVAFAIKAQAAAVTTINAGVGSYSWSAKSTVLITANSDRLPVGGNLGVGSLLLAASGPTTITASVGAYNYVGTTAGVTQLINASVAGYTYTGTTSAIIQLINGSVGAYTYIGSTSAITSLINASTGAYTWTGTTSVVTAPITIISSVIGGYSWLGTTSEVPTQISTGIGTYSWVGSTSTLGGGISASIGTYTWSGTTANIPSTIYSSVGTYSWNGTTALTTQLINQSVGGYTWNATTSGVGAPIVVVSESIGTYAWTGTTSTVAGGGGAVWPLPSQVAFGVTYGPTGADYIGTNIGNITYEVTTGQMIKPLTSKISIIL